MRFIISTLPLLLALSTFTTAETTDGAATSADIAVGTDCAEDNALKECFHSMPALTSTSTSTATPSGYTETDGNANEVDVDDDDDDDDEDSGIKEGYPAKSYSGLEPNITPSEGNAVGYTTSEWGLIWGCLVGVGLGVLL